MYDICKFRVKIISLIGEGIKAGDGPAVPETVEKHAPAGYNEISLPSVNCHECGAGIVWRIFRSIWQESGT